MLLDDEGALFYDQDMYMDKDHNGKGAFDTMHLHVRENFAVSHARNIVSFVSNVGIVELESENKEYWALYRYYNEGENERYFKNALNTGANFYQGIRLFKDGSVVTTLASQTSGLVITYTDGTTASVNYSIANSVISATLPTSEKVIAKITLKVA